MSLGSTYNNNQGNNRGFEFSMYSAYRMNNAESKIDPTCMTFRYWKNNLCISISPRKNTGNDEISFDMDNGITIYLTHTKCRILKHEIELFLQDPIKYNSVGVPSGQAIITISNGSEYGKDAPCITIRKVNDVGDVVASFAYEFKRDYYHSVRNYDGKNFDMIYEDYRNIEIEQLITELDEHIKACTGAVSFSVNNQFSYSPAFKTLSNSIDGIANALGVETTKNNSQRRYSNNSYFNQSNSNSGKSTSPSNISYGAASIDDLE